MNVERVERPHVGWWLFVPLGLATLAVVAFHTGT